MPRPLIEIYAERFLEWERNGRGGLPTLDTPVAPEPPFLPFDGYSMPRPSSTTAIDDGHRPSLLGRMLGGSRSRGATETPEEEPEIEPVFDLCSRSETVEIGVFLPPEFSATRESSLHFVQSLDGFAEPVGFEIFGSPSVTEVQFSASMADAPALESMLTAFFPEAVLEVRKGRLSETWAGGSVAAIFDCSLRDSFLFPIDSGQRLDPLIGLIGAMSALPGSCCAAYQVLFQKTRHPWAQSIENALFAADGSPVFPDEKDLAKAAKDKVVQPLFATVVRIAVAAADAHVVWPILTQLGASIGVFANPGGNVLQPVISDDYPFADHESDLLARETRRFGMLLGADELIALAHLPSKEVRSPKLVRHIARSHSAPPELVGDGSRASGLYLGANTHRGETKLIHLPADIRVRHMHVIGTPGSGKSNLLANMICDDVSRGEGLAVLDPHGDLIEAVLARIPRKRAGDVVLLDPTDSEASVGFNILSAQSESERTLLSSDLVSMFERLSTSWGDQMNVVLRNAILAFLTSDQGGTLADLRRFVDKEIRAKFLPTIRDLHVREYWERYFQEYASKGSVGAVVTRLGELLESPTIRYVLGQKQSTIDFADIMNSGKIFLCKLPAGLVGQNDAYLFGSLIVAKLQQSAMARQSVAAEERRDFWLYIDEFQNFITPSMAQVIAETRKYRMGMILAHQRLQQLEEDRAVASAIELMNTKMVFEVGDHDANKLGDAFGHFDADDLRTLDVGKAVVRVGRKDHDFNLQVPLYEKPDSEEAERATRIATEMSRQRYSRPRPEIEAEMLRGLGITPEGSEASPSGTPGQAVTEADTTPPEALSKSPKLKDEPKRTPAEGRGGSEHRGAVGTIQRVAEDLAMLSSIEKPLDSGGYVDIEVVTPEGAIAFEICITTDTENEVSNALKCVDAGYDRVVTICRGKGKAKAIGKRLEAATVPEHVRFEQLNYPISADALIQFFRSSPESTVDDASNHNTDAKPTESIPEEPKERVIGSHKIASHFAAADDPASKRQAEQTLKLISELMAKPPEQPE